MNKNPNQFNKDSSKEKTLGKFTDSCIPKCVVNGVYYFDDEISVYVFNGGLHIKKSSNLHRAGNKPAVIMLNGRRSWFFEGKRHRTNDAAVVEGSYLSKKNIKGQYFLHGCSFQKNHYFLTML